MNKKTSVTAFVQSDFLHQVRYSLGLSMGLPDPKRGYVLTLVEDRVWFRFAEKSLLQIRDLATSSDPADRLNGQAEIIGLVKSTASRFHWMLIPHHEEIFRWSGSQNVRFIEDVIHDWQEHFKDPPTGLVLNWPGNPQVELLQDASVSVVATLLDQLPADSYESLLAKN